ncbi:hypothetical protein, partial [Klebsiella pneumoniae]|uniref:hypothetical protein n=1 Tax=Klebsiella pneumoniae TaxID=573 RepID=UPI0021E842AC
CVLPENPASYRVVRTKSYLFNKARGKCNRNVYLFPAFGCPDKYIRWILAVIPWNYIGKYLSLFHKHRQKRE